MYISEEKKKLPSLRKDNKMKLPQANAWLRRKVYKLGSGLEM
jgi:hypothetical protein